MITLTPRAVVKALTLAKKEGKPPILRVGVKGGGCSGMSYVLDFIHEINESDIVEAYESLQVVCDPKSLQFVSDLVLDFETNLLKSGWKFTNPKATKSCSCGESFSV